MPRPRSVRIPPFPFAAGRLHARLVRARPGSVLILVVAVLVLLALIATAWMTTVRIDRQAVARNEDTTEFDLLVEGAVNAEAAALVRRLYAGGRFRPDGYPNADGLDVPPSDPNDLNAPVRVPGDPNLADRVPAPGPGGPFWPRISASPFQTDAATQFESPRRGDAPYGDRLAIAPTSVTLPAGPGGATQTFPALRLPDGRVVLAADTDGDGIADAGLIRMPVGQANGMTFYCAFRALDNGSALNVNVATKPFSGGDAGSFPSAVPGNLFPTNISLYDLLQDRDRELQRVTAFRYAGASTEGLSLRDAWSLFGDGAYRDGGGGVRPDMRFTSPYEAMFAQLAARPGNPGLHGPPPGGANTALPYHAFSLSDSMALAYRFCLANPEASLSPLENCLLTSTRSAFSVRAPYRPEAVKEWFEEQFDYDNRPDMPLRPLLVARNPVSTFVPDRFVDRGSGYVRGQAYYVGDRIYDPGARRSFVCIRDILPVDDVAPDVIVGSRAQAYWAIQPWTSHPTKISVNTGTFGQLFGAYWSAMGAAPYVANRDPKADVVDSPATKLRQFKSFVRLANTSQIGQSVPLAGRQVRQLRAALAAVNTMDLRDADDTVTSRTITLTGSDGKPQYSVDVFGAERQPYISELFVDWDPTPGKVKQYVAVELYNPHAVPISLKGFKLARAGRDGGLDLFEMADLSPLVSIGAGERVLVENFGNDPRPDDVKSVVPANTRAIQGTLTLLTTQRRFYAPVHRSLYLLRTRSPDGVRAVSDAPWDRYEEEKPDPGNPTKKLPNLSDFVPLDQVDVSNIIVAPPGPDGFAHHYRWRYARASQPSANVKGSTAWHCVYPGLYRFPPPSASANDEWFATSEWPLDGTNDLPWAEAGLGLPKVRGKGPAIPGQGWCTYPQYSRPIQVAALDAAGPNAGAGFAPHGGFARNGDILQVPFIGSYTIRDAKKSTNPALDMVSLPLDSTYAEDGDADKIPFPGFDPKVAPPDTTPPGELPDDFVLIPDPRPDRPDNKRTVPIENIGRFAPLFYPPPLPLDLGKYTYFDDYAALPANVTPNDSKKKLVFWDQLGRLYNSSWRYHFALDLFDYLDVRSPQDDYLPNVDPGDPYSGRAGGIVPGQTPDPVNNGPGTLASDANKGQEDATGEEGKVNVNTASWRVLAAVPMITNSAGDIAQPANTRLAKAIVYYRDVADETGYPHGPFRSLFELLKVRASGDNLSKIAFQNSIHGVNDMADPYEVEVDDADGDLSPYNRNPAVGSGSPPWPERDGVDHVYSDFKAQNLALTRISNLLTTRSDSFTVYVLVQAWRGAGTDTPELVEQRRVVFLADRTSVRPLPPTGPKPDPASPGSVAPSVPHTPMNIVIMPNN